MFTMYVFVKGKKSSVLFCSIYLNNTNPHDIFLCVIIQLTIMYNSKYRLYINRSEISEVYSGSFSYIRICAICVVDVARTVCRIVFWRRYYTARNVDVLFYTRGYLGWLVIVINTSIS